jgi:hypothetical protein
MQLLALCCRLPRDMMLTVTTRLKQDRSAHCGLSQLAVLQHIACSHVLAPVTLEK